MRTQLNQRPMIALLVFIFISTALSAQTGNWNVLVPDNNMVVGNNIFLKHNVKDVEGTPLLFDTWLKGYVVLNNENKLENIRINVLNQDGELFVSKPYADMDVKYNVDESVVSHFVVIDSITGKESRFQYLKADQIEGAVEKARFYELLAEGPRQFIKLGTKDFLLAEQEKAYALNQPKSRYILEETYFFRSDTNSKYRLTKLKKKDIQGVLGSEFLQQAKSLMKSNKWSWSKESDIVKLLQALK